MPTKRDMDERMIYMGNDEHGYKYVGGSDGPRKQVKKGGSVCNVESPNDEDIAMKQGGVGQSIMQSDYKVNNASFKVIAQYFQ